MSDSVLEKGLVPKLRFPEFSGEWADISFGTLYQFARSYPVSRDNLNEQSGPVKMVHYGDIHTKFSSHVDFAVTDAPYLNEACGDLFNPNDAISVGDLIFADASEDLGDVGKAIEVAGLAQVPVAAGMHTILAKRRSSSPEPGFGGFYVRSPFAQAQIRHQAQGTKVFGISGSRLARIRVVLPSDSAEQRKIAECLQSLDELIGAEIEKLEALKRHKKGLLQQLFPAEGETTPRLRFPQFRDAGEWAYRTLGELAENLDNRRVPISSNQRTKGATPYYGASGIVDYVEGYIFDEVLLCVSEDGANLVARSTPIAFTVEGKTWVNNHAHVLKFANKHLHLLVEAYLNEMDLRDFITGMAQPKLNRGMLDTITMPLPSSQNEVVSVAEVINIFDRGLAEAAKFLEALHDHKVALMQQLFPSIDELDGITP